MNLGLHFRSLPPQLDSAGVIEYHRHNSKSSVITVHNNADFNWIKMRDTEESKDDK